MARTAVVNPRKRKRRRPKAYGAAKRRKPRRRRNPNLPQPRQSAYSSTPGGYYRRPNRNRVQNPDFFKLETYTRVAPAATAGNWLARWAVKKAGPFKPDAKGIPTPGMEHALFVAAALHFGAPIVGNMFGGGGKYNRYSQFAQISGLGYLGDLFMRRRFMRDSAFIKDNLSMEGFETSTPLGATAPGQSHLMRDANGNLYQHTAQGWRPVPTQAAQPAPRRERHTADAQGRVYDSAGRKVADSLAAFYSGSVARELEMPTPDLPGGSTPSDMDGFESKTRLGRGVKSVSGGSSFGYSRQAA